MDLRGYGCCPPKHTNVRTQNQTVYRATHSYVTICVYHKGQDRTGQDVLRQMIIILHASIDRLSIGSRLLHLGVTCNGDASLGSIHRSIVYRATVLTCIYTCTCFMAREKFRFEKQKSTHREGQSNDTDI